LNDGILCFKKDLALSHNFSQEYSASLFNNVIDPAKKFYDEQKTVSCNLKKDFIKAEKDYKDALYKYDKAKQNFFYYAKYAEQYKYDYEMYKISNMPTPEKKLSLENKSIQAMVEAKDAEKQYQNQYKSVNASRLSYIEVSRQILNDYQIVYDRFISYLQDLLKKNIFFQITLVKSHDFNLESKLEVTLSYLKYVSP